MALTEYEVAMFLGRELVYQRERAWNYPLAARLSVAYGLNCYTVIADGIFKFNSNTLSRSTRMIFKGVLVKYFSGLDGPVCAGTLLPVLQKVQGIAESFGRSVDQIMVPGISFISFAECVGHISDEIRVSLVSLISTLVWINLNRPAVLFGSGLTCANLIEAAKAKEGANVANADMVEAYHMEIKATPTVSVHLNSIEKKILSRELGREPLYKIQGSQPRDHPVLAALREVLRQDYAKSARIATVNAKTLVVGASRREVKEYHHNPLVHYHFSGKEGKDLVRTSLILQRELIASKLSNMKANEKKMIEYLRNNTYIVKRHIPAPRVDLEEKIDDQTYGNYFYDQLGERSCEEVVAAAKAISNKNKKMSGIKPVFTEKVKKTLEVMKAAGEVERLNQIPGRFHFVDLKDPDGLFAKNAEGCRKITFQQLVFEDVGYNFSVENWLEWFHKTGASYGVGYMALPIQLLYDGALPSDYYMYSESEVISRADGSTCVRFLSSDSVELGSKVKVTGPDHTIYGSIGISSDRDIRTASRRIISAMSNNADNGYSHFKDDWSTLLKHPVLSSSKFPFSLTVSLTRRWGCMTMFNLTRVDHREMICRNIQLHEHEQFVRVLDMQEMVKRVREEGKQGLLRPRPYFSVLKKEFNDTVMYALSVSSRSADYLNLVSYLKNQLGGVSLVTNELLSKWRLPACRVNSFAYTAYFYSMYMRTDFAEAAKIARASLNVFQRIWHGTMKMVRELFDPVAFLWNWLETEHLWDHLVYTPAWNNFQWDVTNSIPKVEYRESDKDDPNELFDEQTKLTKDFLPDGMELPPGMTVDEWMAWPESLQLMHIAARRGSLENIGEDTMRGRSYLKDTSFIPNDSVKSKLEVFLKAGGKLRDDDDFVGAYTDYSNWHSRCSMECPVCMQLSGKMGEQILECQYKQDSEVNFFLDKEQLGKFREELRAQSNTDNSKYGALLRDVLDLTPHEPFSRKARVEYIKGGPGTGKSYIIRQLADPVRDLVVAPFLKLRPDYVNQNIGGEIVNWNFHTQHKAIQTNGHRVIFVDEYTAYDWRLLSLLVYRNNASLVYLVGDEQQTGIMESKGEGLNTAKKIKLAELSTHVPVCNFRNPKRDVKVLNHWFSTRMIPKSNVESGYKFGKFEDFDNYIQDSEVPRQLMHYSDHTGQILMADQYNSQTGKTTVRSNQGSTMNDVLLPLTGKDSLLTMNSQLNFVALSRHRNSLTILLDEGEKGAGYHLADWLLRPPEHVERNDYLINLYLGNLLPDSGNFALADSEVMLSFREVMKKYDGFVPYDVESADTVPSGVEYCIDTDLALKEYEDKLMGLDVKSNSIKLLTREKKTRLFGNGTQGRKTADVCSSNDFPRSSTDSSPPIQFGTVGLNGHESTDGASSSNSGRHDSSDEFNDSVIEYSPGFGISEIGDVLEDTLADGDNRLVIAEQSFQDDTDISIEKLQYVCQLLKGRGKRCLLDAVLNVLDISEFTLVQRIHRLSSLDAFHDWVVSERESDWSDCVNFADWFGLRMSVISYVNGKRSEHTTGFGVPIVICHGQIGNKGHYFDPKDVDDLNWDSVESLLTRMYGPKKILQGVYQTLGHMLTIVGSKTVKKKRALTVDELSPEFIRFATFFVPRMLEALPEFVLMKAPPHAVTEPKPPHDSYMMLRDFDLTPGLLDGNVEYLNSAYSTTIGDRFVTGVVDTSIVSPLNMRGNPVNDVVKYRSMGVAPALLYFKRNRWQELQVQQARYLFRACNNITGNRMGEVANVIADRFVDECLSPNHAAVLNWPNLHRIVEKALRDMVHKNYEGQMDVEFTVNSRVCRFALKDIAKPIKEPTVKLGKAGQGILAWSKEAHVKFMIAFRVLNELFLKSCNHNVVYDNTFSEEEFVERINGAMSLVPSCAVNGVIDATACDSGQGPFTQLIERRVYSRLGVNSIFLDWYFSFRESYIMQSRYVRAHMKYVKTSGEPGTLLGNTILMGALMNGFLRGDGPMALAMKGDDGFKRQMNLHVDWELVREVKQYSSLDFKLDVDIPVTFCGYALSKGKLHANIVRKAIKIASHRFKDYLHFAEYQTSLRDWLARIPKEPDDFAEFLLINAELSDRHVEDMRRLYWEILSFSRIGKNQFEQLFEERTVDFNNTPEPLGGGNVEVETAFANPVKEFVRKAARISFN